MKCATVTSGYNITIYPKLDAVDETTRHKQLQSDDKILSSSPYD